MKRAGRKSLAQTPSPKEERIYGSKVNREGSASSETEAKSISFSDKVMEILKKKQKEYNKENPSTKVSIDVLKAVFRRGAGAYSSSHRPTITGGRPNSRTAWAIARVNKFLEKRSGKEVKKAYVQDDDLLKKYSEGGRVVIGKPKVFYTRTYADGTKQEFSVDDYEKNVLPNLNKYHLGGDMSKHLAPNGKPSNLNHEQWHLVRTPEFKAWFGDWENDPENASKVVDANGEPLVVYHGTKEYFTEFKKENQNLATGFGDFGAGFYFTSSYDTAKYYTLKFEKRTIFSVFLKTLNPFVIELNWEKFSVNTIQNYEKLKGLYDWQRNAINSVLIDKNDYRPSKTITKAIGDFSFQDLLIRNGFDGVFVNRFNIYEVEDANHISQILPLNEIVVFEPEQIKLADGSNTTFDPENPDIRFAKGGMVEVVLNEGNGVAINKLYNEWANIKTQKQQDSWAQKVRQSKFGTYGTIGFLEVLDKFEFMQSDKVNGVMKRDFIEEVKDALNTYAEGGLIAPNGKQSNLNAEQYKLVRTKAFKDWFGDWENDPENASKVVDENGEPLLCSHRTNENFTIFDIKNSGTKTDSGYFGKGFYFSPNVNGNKTYGERLLKVFLNVKNPKYTYSYNVQPNNTIATIVIRGEYDFINNTKVSADKINEIQEIVVFEPEQIKLADGSNTTFDGSNPDIRFAEGGSVEQTPKFGAVENSKYKGWSEEKVMSYEFPEIIEIAEKHHTGYGTIRKEFIKGIFVEREHTSDWGMSAHVSLQHVFENPKYYTILQSLGL